MKEDDLKKSREVQIVFSELSYTVKVKDNEKKLIDKPVLKSVAGILEPCRLAACMGASGAGKTSFLNVLAGYKRGLGSLAGEIRVNGNLIHGETMRDMSAFVHQEDMVLETMTVFEALIFSANMRLPVSMSKKDKLERVQGLVELLNLSKCIDTLVGSTMKKGISGGEKRRLSMGIELVTDPSVFFLDEPTSGLDTYNAHKVISILCDMAHVDHRTVVCTIHQPSSDIFHMFDDLIVLAGGQVMFHGEAKDMVDHFGDLGYVCPEYTNPADFLFMHVLNRSEEVYDGVLQLAVVGKVEPVNEGADPETAPPMTEKSQMIDLEEENRRIQGLVDSWQAGPRQAALAARIAELQQIPGQGLSTQLTHHKVPWWFQFWVLFCRAGLQMLRNKMVFVSTLVQVIATALLLGFVYLQVGTSYTSIQNREGSLFFGCVAGFFGAALGVLTVFGLQKPVFVREYGSRMYSIFIFFWSRWLVELPMYIIAPIVFSSIAYFLVGYQSSAAKFWIYAAVIMLSNMSGACIGMLASCAFGDIAIALNILPSVLMPLIIFSGFFLNTANAPKYFIWVPYISPLKYSFVALIKNEFTDLAISCTPSDPCTPGFNGNSVIANLNMTDEGSIAFNIGILILMDGGLLILSYLALLLSVKRQQI